MGRLGGICIQTFLSASKTADHRAIFSAQRVCIESSQLRRKHVVKEEEEVEGKTNFKKIKRAELSSR